jgi:hypothetical protein
MRSLVLVLVLLGACTTYPDACNRRALGELRTVDRLIAETRSNLARGYGYERVPTNFSTGFVLCSGGYNARICTGNDTRYTRRAVAVDPQAERRKLDTLIARREELSTAAAACVPR